MLKVYIGYDSRQVAAHQVAAYTLQKHARKPVSAVSLSLERLERSGLLRRPREYLDGRMWDTLSDAPMSTEFAISRFLTPLLAQTGWALFVDSDVVFMDDVNKLLSLADPKYAVMCVKHIEGRAQSIKMDGQIQTQYARKNWSSVMLFNCEHPSNQCLTLAGINNLPGRDLHRFYWLEDSEIGALPSEWNWLVNVEEIPSNPKIAHFTLGGPWFDDWKSVTYDWLWNKAYKEYLESIENAKTICSVHPMREGAQAYAQTSERRFGEVRETQFR